MSVPYLVIIYMKEFKMTDEQGMEQDPFGIYLFGAQKQSEQLVKRFVT